MNRSKQSRNLSITVGAMAFLATLVLLPPAANAVSGPLSDYERLKNIEKRFPLPSARRVVTIGTIYPGANAPNPSMFYEV